MQKNSLLNAALVGCFVVFASGCTATAEMEKMESMRAALDEVQSVAQQALREAQQASGSAASAEQKADEALQAANEASQCCRANSDKIDRMFKKAMTK